VSALSSLNTARMAMSAQQRALDVTSQNVANVNTDGYSRQRADLQSIGASTVPAFFSVNANVSGGVTADTVQRIRDSFMEGRAQVEHATSAELTVVSGTYSAIEDAFREPGDSGLQETLNDMWSSWDDLANSPDTDAARSAVLETTTAVAASMKTTRSTLDQLWGQTHDSLGVLVQDANATAGQIAALNKSIQSASQAGQDTNELSDKRDSLVLTLAASMGATSSPAADGMVNVFVGGSTLVTGSSSISLAVQGATTADELAAKPLAVVTVPGGTTLDLGGTAGGDLTALREVIPQYRDAIDTVARNLASTLNAGHVLGTDLNGATGKALLGTAAGSTVPADINAANLTVLITKPAEVAASRTPGKTTTDASNAAAMNKLAATGGVDSGYRAVITQLGVAASVSTRNTEMQATITATVDASRDSVSGVSLDEEMTQMLAFQHGYEAAARMITAMDSVLDTLINSTGLVGR
jgi:flagellar hook-associated protein 1 FlgK